MLRRLRASTRGFHVHRGLPKVTSSAILSIPWKNWVSNNKRNRPSVEEEHMLETTPTKALGSLHCRNTCWYSCKLCTSRTILNGWQCGVSTSRGKPGRCLSILCKLSVILVLGHTLCWRLDSKYSNPKYRMFSRKRMTPRSCHLCAPPPTPIDGCFRIHKVTVG